MSIIDIIQKAGLENVSVQTMHGSFVGMNAKKKETHLTIATEDAKAQSVAHEVMTGKEGQWVGLLVWIPRERLKP